MEPMNEQIPLDEYTDEQLRHAYRCCARGVTYSANNFRDELFRRSQEKTAKALNIWTFVMAFATLVNIIVAIWQVLRNAH